MCTLNDIALNDKSTFIRERERERERKKEKKKKHSGESLGVCFMRNHTPMEYFGTVLHVMERIEEERERERKTKYFSLGLVKRDGTNIQDQLCEQLCLQLQKTHSKSRIIFLIDSFFG